MSAKPLSLLEVDQALTLYSAELQVWKDGGSSGTDPFSLIELLDELLDARLELMWAAQARLQEQAA